MSVPVDNICRSVKQRLLLGCKGTWVRGMCLFFFFALYNYYFNQITITCTEKRQRKYGNTIENVWRRMPSLRFHISHIQNSHMPSHKWRSPLGEESTARSLRLCRLAILFDSLIPSLRQVSFIYVLSESGHQANLSMVYCSSTNSSKRVKEIQSQLRTQTLSSCINLYVL